MVSVNFCFNTHGASLFAKFSNIFFTSRLLVFPFSGWAWGFIIVVFAFSVLIVAHEVIQFLSFLAQMKNERRREATVREGGSEKYDSHGHFQPPAGVPHTTAVLPQVQVYDIPL